MRLVRETLPAAAADRDAILAFIAFPRKVWRQIWSSNPPGGTVATVVGIFPRP